MITLALLYITYRKLHFNTIYWITQWKPDVINGNSLRGDYRLLIFCLLHHTYTEK